MHTTQSMYDFVIKHGTEQIKAMMEAAIKTYGSLDAADTTIVTAYQLTCQRLENKPALAS